MSVATMQQAAEIRAADAAADDDADADDAAADNGTCVAGESPVKHEQMADRT